MLLTRMREGCFLGSKVSMTLPADLYVYLPVGQPFYCVNWAETYKL